MANPPSTEFYDGNNQSPFVRFEGTPSFVVGQLVNVRKENWEVVGISWSVDHFDAPRLRHLRQNVILEKVK